MKTLYLVINKENNFVLDVHDGKEETEFYLTLDLGQKKFNLDQVFIRKENNVSDEVAIPILHQFKRKISSWN